jgi:hypothetical protein
MIKQFSLALALTLTALLSGPAPGYAEGPRVLNEIVINTNGHYNEFIAAHARARAIYKRLDDAKRRVWREVTDGKPTDVVHVIAEYDSVEAMNAAQKRRAEDAEMSALVKETANGGWTNISSKIFYYADPIETR